MRLWSLHPAYLDAKGLVALWREGLLAKAVLSGHTRGYNNHPQLQRFKAHPDTKVAINDYLLAVYEEAERRGYHFDVSKLDVKSECAKIRVTEGQLDYEWSHLQSKLLVRDGKQYQKNVLIVEVESHPSMEKIPGLVEPWERISRGRS